MTHERSRLATVIVLAVVLMLCAGGGFSAYLMLRDADGRGADDPRTAASDFLAAVYTERSARRAAALTCASSRDEDRIAKKVAEISESVRPYPDPQFTWEEPTVQEQTDERALVAAKVTLTTGDDRISAQELRLTVVRDTGWWVCEVEPA